MWEGNALAVDHLVIEDDDLLVRGKTERDRQPWPEDACIHELMPQRRSARAPYACKVLSTYDQFKAVRVAEALGPVYLDDRARFAGADAPWSRRFAVF